MPKTRGFDKTCALQFRLSIPYFGDAHMREVNGSEHLFTVVLICQDLPAAHALYVIFTMAERSRRSKVWLSFSKKDENTANCITCKKDISCKGGSTSNMMKHLLQHRVNLKECSAFDSVRSLNSSTTGFHTPDKATSSSNSSLSH